MRSRTSPSARSATCALRPFLAVADHGLNAACGNKTLAVQVAVLRDIVVTHLEASISRDLSEPATPARFRRQVRSLNKLIEIVEARDSDGAESHWRAHLEAAAKSMSRMVPMDRQVVDLFSPETRPRSE